MRILLDHHADPNFQDDEKNTPLHVAAATGLIFILNMGRKEEARREEESASSFLPSLCFLSYSCFPLSPFSVSVLACRMQADAATVLLNADANPDMQNVTGATPLMVATQSRSPGTIDLFIQHHGQPSIPDFAGKSPLYVAVETRFPKLSQRYVNQVRFKMTAMRRLV